MLEKLQLPKLMTLSIMADKKFKNYIVDASFILSFLLNEGNKTVENIIEEFKKGDINLTSVTLLSYEVGNGLRTGVLRKRLSKDLAEKLYLAFLELEIAEEKVEYAEVLNEALIINKSFYDASYIYLAKKLHYPFLTLD